MIDINKQLKIAGGIHMLMAFTALIMAGLYFRALIASGILNRDLSTGLLAMLALQLLLVLLVVSCEFFIGLGLFYNAPWIRRTEVYSWQVFTLFSVPMGTIIGGYTIWLLNKLKKGNISEQAPSDDSINRPRLRR